MKTTFYTAIILILLSTFLHISVSGQDRRAVAEQAMTDAKSLAEKHNSEASQSAIKKYEEALVIWRELGDKAKSAETLNDIGSIYRELGDATKALEYFEQSLTLAREIKDKSKEAASLLYQGQCYDLLGNTRRQLELYEQALAIAREGKDQKNELFALGSLGYVYYRLGDYQKSIDYNKESLRLYRAIGDKEGEAIILVNTGAIYQALGKTQESIDFFLQALPLMRELKMAQNEAVVLNNIGSGYSDLGEKQKAIDYYTQSLEIRRKSGDRRGEAVSLGNLGGSYFESGNTQKAIEFYEQALAIHRELKALRSQGNALNNLGRVFAAVHDYNKAFEYYSQALPIRRETGDSDGESNSLHSLAFVERERGNLNEARSYVEGSIGIIESIRATLKSEDLRSSYFALSQDVYSLYIDILMDMHAKEPAKAYDGLALQTAERARARSLLDLLSEAKADIRKDADKGLMDQEQELRKQIKAKDDLRSRISDRSKAETLDQEIRSMTLKYEDVLAEIRLKNPRYAAITQPRASSLVDIQKMLDSDTLLLEYSLGLNKSYLWVVSQSSIKTFVLPKRTEIEDKARSFYSLVSKSESAADAKRAAKELGSMLLDPAASELADRRLVIVTDGVLGYIPFSALTTSKSADPLIAGHEVVYLPSASTLAALREENPGRSSASKTIAVIADPVFNATDTRVIRNGGAQSPVPASEALLTKATREAGFMSVLPRLPGTRSEATKILSFVPEGERKSSMDFDASISTVMDPDLGRYRIIHFATHGLLNSHHPELSGIVLSLVDKNGKPQEGFLRLNDIFNLKLPADLVVLSACQTALGKEVRGEGLIGLTRGFMYAGARRVVASQWAVDDEATSELMRSFYQRMLGEKKLRPSAALREAQLSLLKTKRFNAPYFWSAFAIQGDWK